MATITYSHLTPPPRVTSLQSLKHVLHTLADHDHQVTFRFRLLGEMWQHNFMRVISVSGNSVAFRDEVNGRLVVLSNLNMIIQFEVDSSLLSLEPNTHYEVVAT